VPQGLVVRFGLGLDALCKIKSNQIKNRTSQPAADTHVRLSHSTIDFSVCIVPRGGGPSAGAWPPPYSPSSPSPLSIEPTCSRPACQDSHALHTTHRCHLCCSHLRFDDPVSPPTPATITTLCSVHLRHAQPCKTRKSPWSTPFDSSRHRQQRAFGSLLPSSTYHRLRHPLRIRHQKTRLGACQPARSLPAAFGGQLLQGSVCS